MEVENCILLYGSEIWAETLNVKKRKNSIVIETITAANTVGVTKASRDNQASVSNYLEGILRLKKRDLEAAEYVGVPTQMTLANVSNEIRNRDLDERNSGD